MLLVLAILLRTGTATADSSPPVPMRTEVIASYPHDIHAFTQGLLLHDGALYESTGQYGQSSLRQVELATGTVQRKLELPKDLFGEGLALAGGTLYQLTWREGIALTYDLASFTRSGELKYGGDGWGLCFDGTQFIQTDGSNKLIFRDPATFAVTRQVAVMDAQGRPMNSLNELECVGDAVYANIWLTDRIVEIAKLNGHVRAEIDARGLLTPEEHAALQREATLNGIAYDPSNNTFLITGKYWPKLFRVRFVPK